MESLKHWWHGSVGVNVRWFVPPSRDFQVSSWIFLKITCKVVRTSYSCDMYAVMNCDNTVSRFNVQPRVKYNVRPINPENTEAVFSQLCSKYTWRKLHCIICSVLTLRSRSSFSRWAASSAIRRASSALSRASSSSWRSCSACRMFSSSDMAIWFDFSSSAQCSIHSWLVITSTFNTSHHTYRLKTDRIIFNKTTTASFQRLRFFDILDIFAINEWMNNSLRTHLNLTFCGDNLVKRKSSWNALSNQLLGYRSDKMKYKVLASNTAISW